MQPKLKTTRLDILSPRFFFFFLLLNFLLKVGEGKIEVTDSRFGKASGQVHSS